MKDYTRQLLKKAGEAIEAAELLLANQHTDFSAGRAYYAMFYTAEALLNEQGWKFGKHSSVHAAFGEHFAKTKLLDPKFHRWLLNSFDKRLVGDYGVETVIQADNVVEMIERAKEFLQAARKFLRANS